MADATIDMRLYQNRFETYGKDANPTKKRRSSGGGAITKSWPHETPTPAELAFAGFYYNPSPKAEDNVVCFHCHVKLDGWEIDDIPIREHLAHSPDCAWAVSTSVTLGNEDRDPLSEKLLAARLATFGTSWPYEKKRGWKCKSKKLAEAGWCMDPSMAGEDGTTCFYCNLSLDGWEPKDDPTEEHRKREPNCAFFALVERHASSRPKKSRARTSTASKASRLSIQSVQSTFSEAPSLMSLGDNGPELEGDTSIGTVTSTTSTAKGRKPAAKKGGRGKKKAVPEPAEDTMEMLTALEDSINVSHVDIEEPQTQVVEEVKPEPAKKATRGKGRSKKATAKANDVVEAMSQSQMDPTELEDKKPAPKAKRGKKRTSDGEEKVETPAPELAQSVADEPPAKAKKATKSTRGKKAKAAAEEEVRESQVMEVDVPELEPKEETAKPKRGRKPKATKAAKPPTPEPEPQIEPEPEAEPETEPEPVMEVDAEDESANFVVHGEEESEANFVVHEESEANFIVHNTEQDESDANFVVRSQSPPAQEFEPSPTPQKAPVARARTPQAAAPPSTTSTPHSARSHNSSDGENHPPSSNPPASRGPTTKQAPIIIPPAAPSPPAAITRPFESPAKTIRIPLAAHTPNRSPSRVSPQKLGTLKTTMPWAATDIETVFFPSEADGQENAGSGVARKLVELGGQLSSPEKKMTVEEWVRFQALKGEERLKEECERMVWLFEREGTRALGVLGGLEVSL
ncbi:hypothetical protein K461DRAFT_296714 [Myriangium duriaei CBS 260.36]|uniref:BIR-domain-containing protein n=1 Tax=Myriangium duriaei CBS 260.36 TaxID=1168546 RepID=A0A9P4MDU3_9PEZI|nr:hypothetical protein K461DRAFT_296714 [Myriangium duriaei CBS 260.36]